MWAPLTRPSGRSSLRSCDGDPKYWPRAVTCGELEPVPSEQIEVSLAGACGANSCHAASTSLACDHGNEAKNHEAPRARCVRSEKLVTMPKLPPPPPWHAQNRSSSESAVTRWTRPSAVTIVTASMLSVMRPQRRPASPWPPPSARPATPTEGHEPPGTVRPRLASEEYMSMSCVPGPTRATPFETLTPDSFDRSMTTPSPMVE